MSRAEQLSDIRIADAPATPQEFVESFQRDLLRLAYVLTGNENDATCLVCGVLIDVLTAPEPDESDPTNWNRLLSTLGSRYLAGTYPAINHDEPATDERSRLWHTVELLDMPKRAALVLRDLGGLNPGDVAAVTGYELEELEDVLEWSRDRLSAVADQLLDEPPARLLASLAVDAPRRDLWRAVAPAIEEHEAARKRRSRRIVTGVLAAVFAFSLGTVVWFTGDIPFFTVQNDHPPADDDFVIVRPPTPTRAPEPTPTPAPTPTSVDLIDAAFDGNILLRASILDEGFRGTGELLQFSYDPNAADPIIPMGQSDYLPWYVSPDGRWTVLLHESYDENTDASQRTGQAFVYTRVLSAALDGKRRDWEYSLSSIVGAWDSEIVGDRLYIIASVPEPATLTVLDLMTGEVVATRTLEVPGLGAELRAGIVPLPEGSWYIDVKLFTIPASGDPVLYASLTMTQSGSDMQDRWTRWMYRIDATDLTPTFLNTNSVTAPSVLGTDSGAEPDFQFWGARPLPNGSGLYALWFQSWSGRALQQMDVRVLDFESGDVSSISTGFTESADVEPSDIDFMPIYSNDGRKLYVISEVSGEVAIIDLVGRRLERTFPLDLGGMRETPIEGSFRQLSQDGRWLYIVQEQPGGRPALPTETATLWAVDLTTWRVDSRLHIQGGVRSFVISPDGEQLYVLSQFENQDDPERLRHQLQTFDAASFELLHSIDLSDLVDDNASFVMESMVERYQSAYGRTPTIDGIEPDDVDGYTTLPRARIVIEDGRAPVGITVPVELQFLDPATGEALTKTDTHIRYSPDQPVMLVFEQPGQKSLISVTADLPSGEQQGTIRLKAEGLWNARIIVGDGDSGFTLILPEVLHGTPTMEGDDGQFYDVRIETEPEAPVSVGDVIVRARIVNARTREPIPTGVTLIGGMPETMRVSFVGPGALSRKLEPVEHGLYETTLTFEAPGVWNARLTFRQPESTSVSTIGIEAGTLSVSADGPAP